MATKSKHRKNHKQKLQARKNRIAGEKAQAQKMQREFIMNLIKQEQEKGAFNNTTNINNDPIIDGPTFDGPTFDIQTETIQENLTTEDEIQTVEAEVIENKTEEN